MTVITVFLLLILYVLNFVVRLKKVELLKVCTFERGFVRLNKVQNSFRIHFFVIMLMFVIFDLEIVIFLGLMLRDFNSFISFLLLILFILIGFYIEWWYGKLIWII